MTPQLTHSIVPGQNTGRKVGSFKLLIAFFVLILSTDTISYLLFQNDAMVAVFQKVLSSVVLVFSCLFFLKWQRGDRICFLLFLLLLVKLIAESLIEYHSVLVYPSVLAVVFPFLYVYFIKNLFLKLNIDIVETLIIFIFLGYFLSMLIYGRDFDFNNTPLVLDDTGPFSGDTRILHANSILLMVLPFLYSLNKIFSGRKTSSTLLIFAVSLIIIVIHQHRTVWLTTIFSSLLLLFMKGNFKKLLRKLLFFGLVTAVVFTVLLIALPVLQQLLAERFMDVLDPLNEDNTGGFRYLQILSYLNYFIQKPLFGWTFSGFELSNPFSNAWEEGTGQHFHDAYIEVLFYFGITGFLLKFYPLFSVAKKMKKQLSDKSKILAAFSVSGFLYAFSYVPPLIFWGIVGLCLYYIEKDLRNYNYHQVQSDDGEA